MKRYVRSSTESYQLYRNKRNENKYIEVKKSSDGHTWYRQFMFWNTEKGPVKNYSGAKDNKRGRYHRGTQESLKKILEDYVLVESIEDGVKNDFSYRGSPENPNDVEAGSNNMKRVIKASTSIDVFDIIDYEIRRALKDCAYKAYDQLVKEYENGQGPHPGDQNAFIWDVLHDDNVWNLRKDFTSAIHQFIDDHVKEREAE